MNAFLSVQLGKNLEYIILIAVASLFHRPVLVMMALLVFNSQFILINISSKFVGWLKPLLALAGFFYSLILKSDLLSVVQGYEGDYSGYSPRSFSRISLTFILL